MNLNFKLTKFVLGKTTVTNKDDIRGLNVGSRGGAVVRALAFHQCGLGSIPGHVVISGLSLFLVLVPTPRGFSQDYPVFLPP